MEGQADLRTRYAATGEKAVLADVPEEDREFVTGIWPPEFERILNGESASMLAQDAQANIVNPTLRYGQRNRPVFAKL